jgi:hypothetical protein
MTANQAMTAAQAHERLAEAAHELGAFKLNARRRGPVYRR